MPTLTEYASWCGHNDFAMHSQTMGSSVHSFSTTAGYEAAEHNVEKQSNLDEKAQTSIVRFASFSAHCRRRRVARDLSDALRAQAAVGRENKKKHGALTWNTWSPTSAPLLTAPFVKEASLLSFSAVPLSTRNCVEIYTTFASITGRGVPGNHTPMALDDLTLKPISVHSDHGS